MRSFVSILFILMTSTVVYGQIDTSQENIQEAKVLLSDIQSENSFRHGLFETKMGLMEIGTNKAASPIELNSNDELPFIEVNGDYEFWRHWGVSMDFQYAQNAMGTSGGPNTSSAHQQTIQIGPIYKVILDQINVKNYYSVKLQYYSMTNNFTLVNPQAFYANAEAGYLLGVERSIPATEIIDIVGGFDYVMLRKITTQSITPTSNNGNGLQFRVEFLYNWTKTSRIGLSYVIAAFFNKFTQPDFEGRDRNTQSYKCLGLTYSRLF